jgi:hypothetical protein
MFSSDWQENHKLLENQLIDYDGHLTESSHSPVEIVKRDYLKKYLDKSNLVNFKRSVISMGTLNAPDRPNNIFSEFYPDESILRKFLNLLKLIKRYFAFQYFSMKNGRQLFKYFSEAKTPLQRAHTFFYRFLSDAGLRHSLYYSRIRKEAIFSSVLEIGAGYGGLAHLIMKRSRPQTYFIVDLPENLLLQHYFLYANGHQVLPWVSYDPKLNYENGCCVLLTGEQLSRLQTSVDVCINTMSMQHMTLENIKYYFQQILRLRIGVLYLVNRDKKRDPSDVCMSLYPVPSEYRLFSSKTMTSKIHLENVYFLI